MTSPRSTVRRSAAIRAFGALALGTLCSCSGCALDPEGLSTGEEFVVLPKVVHVQPSSVGPATSFRLEVLSRGPVGNPTNPEPLVWTSNVAGVDIVPDHVNGTAVVTLPDLAAGDGVVITARNGTRAAHALVYFRVVASQGWDEARDDLVDGLSPSVSLLAGNVNGTCQYDRVDAFNGSAIVGQFDVSSTCARADAIVFSEGARPVVTRPFVWTAAQDLVDATLSTDAIVIPMQLVIGIADVATAEKNEADYLLAAGDAFRMSRSGIALLPSAQTIIRELLPSTSTCEDVKLLTGPGAPNPKNLNIYHLAKVVVGGTEVRGVFCTPNVILINHSWALTATLGHEIGHALGLIAPAWGHTDNITGFIGDNLMSATADDGNDIRRRMSLGQLYRVHVDGRSWLRRNPTDLSDGPFLCHCDPYAANVCPALPADVRPLLKQLPAPGGACP